MPILSGNPNFDVLSNTLVYAFGILGILIPLLQLVLMIVFVVRKVGPNTHFGFRSRFALSSPERWEWCNRQLAKYTFIFVPLFLVAHGIVFSLTIVYGWFFPWVILSMLFGCLWMLPTAVLIQAVGKKKFKE